MIDLGLFNPFYWFGNRNEIKNLEYRFNEIDFIVNIEIDGANLVNISTGATTALTTDEYTYTYNGESLTRTRITGTGLSAGTYYLEVLYGGLGARYYTGNIIITDCDTIFSCINPCNDYHYAWDDDSGAFNSPLQIPIHNAVQDDPIIEKQTIETFDTNGDIIKTTKVRRKHRLVAALPRSYENLLQGMSTCETISFETTSNYIRNVTIEKEDLDPFFARFIIQFEYPEPTELKGCCDDFNIDTIITEGTGGGGSCVGFSVSIGESGGTLTVTPTSAPSTPTYRWYRNGVFMSTGSSLVTGSIAGSYKVEAMDSGCFASDSIYISDPCTAMKVEPYVTGDQLNADIVNPISGYTLSVVLNGSEVATSLPYTILASGVYFIYATKDDCTKSAGINAILENLDCSFSLSITRSGNTLTAVTDAGSPSYQWELETDSGRVALGTASTQEMQGQGIYFLTITDGGCEKETYVYYEPSSGYSTILYNVSGYQFDIEDFNLSAITDPATELVVHKNGVLMTYVGSAPSDGTTYTINGSGQLELWSAIPLSNEKIKVQRIP